MSIIDQKRELLRRAQCDAKGKKSVNVKDDATGFALKAPPVVKKTRAEITATAERMGCVLTEKVELEDAPGMVANQTSNHTPGEDAKGAAFRFFATEREVSDVLSAILAREAAEKAAADAAEKAAADTVEKTAKDARKGKGKDAPAV